MSTCIHCGLPLQHERATICNACQWMHLGLHPEIQAHVVIVANYMLAAYNTHFMVKTVEQTHQLMVDLMYGSEDDEKIMEVSGLLRRILEVAVEEEMRLRGYNPDGSPIAEEA